MIIYLHQVLQHNNSEDSRFANIGLVKKEDIIGMVWMIVAPFENIKIIT